MANQTASNVADLVRKAREDSGLSQRKFAARLGWPQPRLSRRESGEVEFRYSELEAIADALSFANVDALLTPAPVDSPLTRESAGASFV